MEFDIRKECLHCKNFIRKEVYNQQWGMNEYWSYCTIDMSNKNIHADCNLFQFGEPIVIDKQ